MEQRTRPGEDDLVSRAAVLLAEWDLRPEGEPRRRRGAVVIPVLAGDGEADLEVHDLGSPGGDAHLALRHWDGRGAVRLLRADPRRRALLLERLPDADLVSDPTAAWDVEACETVAQTYAVLHRPAPASLPRLSRWAAARADELAALGRDAPVPHRLVSQARSLAAALARDEGTDGATVHGSLAYDAVVPTARGPVVVDPAPMSGDPHAEVYPLLVGRWDEVAASHSVRDRLRLRFHTVVDVAGLDEHRARDWVVVRALAGAHAALAGQDPAVREVVTRAVTVAKAVQD